MPQQIELQMAAGHYEGQAAIAARRLLVNYYLEAEQDAHGQPFPVLYQFPGISLARDLAAIAPGPCRGNGVTWGGYAYMVFASVLLQIDAAGNAVPLGTISTSESRVSMVAGANHVVLVDGSAGYVWNGAMLSKITAAGFPATPDYVVNLDNYYIVNNHATGQFYVSSPDDPLTWNALDFATAESRGDALIRPARVRGALALMGETTTEIWQNTGNPYFPFERIAGGAMDVGCAAPDSVAESEAALFWLGKSQYGGGYAVIKLAGMIPQIVSTPALEWLFANKGGLADAQGCCFRWAGNLFYEISLPSSNESYVYSDRTGTWSERKSGLGRHVSAGYVFLGNRQYVGHYQNPWLGALDPAVFTEFGAPVIRTAQTEPHNSGNHLVTYHTLTVEFEPGEGITTGQGADPQAMLAYSDDGGYTWSSELWAPMGKRGEYSAVCRWTRLGAGRSRTFRVSVADPVRSIIRRCWATVDYGAH
jgi:hypothetical protein